VHDQLRLQKLSGLLYWVALVLSVVLPVVVIVYAGKGVSDLVSILPMVAALRGMVRLFGAYRDGEVLSAANALVILHVGRNLLLVALFTVLVPSLQTLILSWQAEHRMLSIGLDGGTLGFLMAAGLLTVIGWAMAEAARVKAENAEFV
jgi:hypothetical protein